MSTLAGESITRNGRRLAIAVVLLAVASATTAATPERDHTADVRVVNRAFSPETVTVDEGPADEGTPGLHAHVNWHFEDPGVDHTVNFDDVSVAAPSSRLREGQTYTVVFEAPGTYTYSCEIHPFMTGTVIVRLPAELVGGEDGDGDGSSSLWVVLVAVAVAVALAVVAVVTIVRRRRVTGLTGS